MVKRYSGLMDSYLSLLVIFFMCSQSGDIIDAMAAAGCASIGSADCFLSYFPSLSVTHSCPGRGGRQTAVPSSESAACTACSSQVVRLIMIISDYP